MCLPCPFVLERGMSSSELTELMVVVWEGTFNGRPLNV